VANNLRVSTFNHGRAVAIFLDAFDPDGDTVTYKIETRIKGEEVKLSPIAWDADSGKYYTIATVPGNFVGVVKFTYTASDGSLTSQPATVTIAVQQYRRPPRSEKRGIKKS
jgi:hypothetical protein